MAVTTDQLILIGEALRHYLAIKAVARFSILVAVPMVQNEALFPVFLAKHTLPTIAGDDCILAAGPPRPHACLPLFPVCYTIVAKVSPPFVCLSPPTLILVNSLYVCGAICGLPGGATFSAFRPIAPAPCPIPFGFFIKALYS